MQTSGIQPYIRRGVSTNPDPTLAVAELAAQLDAVSLNSMLFFCSAAHDPERLAESLKNHFSCPSTGCTTAGEITSEKGYINGSIAAIGFASEKISFTPCFIPSLREFITADAGSRLAIPAGIDKQRHFALLLIDGLSMLEERVTAAIQRQLKGVSLVGGSAGDDLIYKKTSVYYDGAFHSGAAVMALFETDLPFKTFMLNHFKPTDCKLVITEAEPAARKVLEINGKPAAEEYARLIGSGSAILSEHYFANFPLMLKIGGNYYIRSIQSANLDGSLTFFCAIENGLVLTLGRPDDLSGQFADQLTAFSNEIEDIKLILGFDCILRKLELFTSGGDKKIKAILSSYPFTGFSTYGEQFGGVHINQTLTGVIIGGPSGKST
jgi:hypothetical protein